MKVFRWLIVAGLLALASPLYGQKADTVTTSKRDSVPVDLFKVTVTVTRNITVHDTVKVPVPPVDTVKPPVPPDTTPAPPPTGSDEPSPTGKTMAWADNFDRYLTVAEMQWSIGECGAKLPDGRPAWTGPRTEANNDRACAAPFPQFALTTGRTGRALRSIVHADPGHAQQSVPWLSPWQPSGLNYTGRGLAIQYWVRISAGGTPGTYGMKWMEAWFSSSSNSQGRVQWSNESGSDKRPLFHMVLGANPGNSVIRTRQPTCPCWDQINDGQWHRITHLWVLNTTSSYRNTGGNTSASETYTGTSSRDGRVAMWIDGVKMMDYSQATVGKSGPLGPWATQSDVDFIPGVSGTNSVGRVSFLEFPGVFNGSPGAWTLDHDDLLVWGNP